MKLDRGEGTDSARGIKIMKNNKNEREGRSDERKGKKIEERVGTVNVLCLCCAACRVGLMVSREGNDGDEPIS